MANFFYKAKDLKGEMKNGEIESSDARSAVAILRRKGLIVISVSENKKTGTLFLLKWLNRVSFGDLVNMTRQLATMVGAGLILSDALDILSEQEANKTLKQALVEISNDVKSGITLSQALVKHPDIFPLLYVNLVKSGEASGKLDDVLLRMADSLEKEREFKSRVKGAMIYPVLVITMMFAVMLVMMIFVIPKLTALYSQSSIELPLPTQILIGASDALVNYWWLLLAGIIGFIIGFRRWVATVNGAQIYDKLILKVPIIGKLIINITMTDFTRTLGLLIGAGIPLLESIEIVGDITSNTQYKNALNEAYSGVSRGLPFSTLLASTIFPRIVPQMVKVGEETGKVDEIFMKLAGFFESESDHMVKNLTTAIEPLVLIILGVGVGFLVISIILPIYKLTTSF